MCFSMSASRTSVVQAGHSLSGLFISIYLIGTINNMLNLQRSLGRKSIQLGLKCHAVQSKYLKYHNEQIIAKTLEMQLAYMDPKNIDPNAPTPIPYRRKLAPILEEKRQKLQFEEYKLKVLEGKLDDQPTNDGNKHKQKHYYQNLSKVQLMTVSSAQNLDVEHWLDQIYSPHFQPPNPEAQLSFDCIETATYDQLVNLSLIARATDCQDRSLWYAIEKRYHHGQKLMHLTPVQLVKLKYSFDHHQKYGDPKFHEILGSLLAEDVPRLDKVDLMDLFYACRYSNHGVTNVQPSVLKQLEGHYHNMTYAERVNFLLTYTVGNKPLRTPKVFNRERFQMRTAANNLLFKLKLHLEQPSYDEACKILFSMAKLRNNNTRHITEPILENIGKNMNEFCASPQRIYFAITYLAEVENGAGIYHPETFEKLKLKAIQNWKSFSNIQRVRMVFTYWNYGIFDDNVMRMYLSVKIIPCSSLLYYASQIESSQSSHREAEILKCLCSLDVVPLPYFVAYKRFYNLINKIFGCVKAFEDKLLNTEYYFSSYRFLDRFYNVETFQGIKEWEAFSQIHLTVTCSPIENLEVVMFSFAEDQISLDMINETDFVPGSKKLKKTYLAKAKSLQLLGWKHLTFDEQELKKFTALNQLFQILHSRDKYLSTQALVLQKKKLLRKIQLQRMYYQNNLDRLTLEELQTYDNDMKIVEEIFNRPGIMNATLIGGVPRDIYASGDASRSENETQEQIDRRMKYEKETAELKKKAKEAMAKMQKLRDLADAA